MSIINEDGDEQTLAKKQRLKAAVHYTVGRICEESDADVTFTKQTIAALTEATYRQIQTYAVDLELFAKHAKRSTINTEDVKLLARRAPQLHEHISDMANSYQEERLQTRPKKQKTSTSKTKKKMPDIVSDE